MTVARAGGFREGARVSGASASALSESVRRLEAALGVRLLHRTTRSVVPTEAGAQLIERLGPALREVEDALDVVNVFRARPAGTLRLNVPVSAARLVLPSILTPFLATFPEIRVEIVAEDDFVDVVAAGCDAGIRYDERLEQDMIAVPIGPRVQRFATAAAPAYLDRRGRPAHPRDLLAHACIRGRFRSGAMPPWEFERDGEIVKIDPAGPLAGQFRNRRRSCDFGCPCRCRNHLSLRGLAAAASRQLHARAGPGTVVAGVFRPVSLLFRPAPVAGAAQGVCRFPAAGRWIGPAAAFVWSKRAQQRSRVRRGLPADGIAW